MEDKIYDYDKRLAVNLEKVKNSSLSPDNKSVITGFADECLVHGLTTGRTAKYIYYLLKLYGWLKKDFKNANMDDIRNIVREIETSSYASMTKVELKTTVKKLYKWIEKADEYPDLVKWIRPRSHGSTRKVRLPSQILTKEEIRRMIEVTRSPRDRAFISVLYETGGRIGEILFLRLHAIEFDQHGAKVDIPHFGKTGSRRVRIVSSVPYIQDWVNKHPDNTNTDSYLWTGPNNDCLRYGAIRSILTRYARKANIKKPVNPHAFRHARATHLANHLTESQMKIYFGWTQASEMAAVYVHLSGRDVDDAILRLHGIKDEEKEKEKDVMTPRTCKRCELQNAATNTLCERCGLPLNEKAATEMLKDDMNQEKTGQLVTQLLKDDQIRDMLMRKIQEMPRGSHMRGEKEPTNL